MTSQRTALTAQERREAQHLSEDLYQVLSRLVPQDGTSLELTPEGSIFNDSIERLSPQAGSSFWQAFETYAHQSEPEENVDLLFQCFPPGSEVPAPFENPKGFAILLSYHAHQDPPCRCESLNPAGELNASDFLANLRFVKDFQLPFLRSQLMDS